MTQWSDTLTTYSAPRALLDFRRSLIDAWLAGRTQRTRDAYAYDAGYFAAWLGSPTSEDAARHLLSLPLGDANGLVLAWRNWMRDEGHLAPATINRRLAAISSMVKLGRTLGLIVWSLEVPHVKSARYRDTRGPGSAAVHEMVHQTVGITEAAVRSRALQHLLYDLGLRRDEALSRDWTHFDSADHLLTVRRKGHTEDTLMHLPDPTFAALSELRLVRGIPSSGPIFVSVDRVHPGHRLTGESARLIVRDAGKRAGIEKAVRPHGLRHAAITEVLEVTGGNVRAAQRFSGHADFKVLVRYDDNRADIQGEMADLIAIP